MQTETNSKRVAPALTRRELMRALAGATAGLALPGFGFSGRCFGAAPAAPLAPSPAAPPVDPFSLDLGFIDQRIQQTVDADKLEGIGLVLFTRDKVFYRKGFGTDTPETTHLIASATKLASCTCLMTLVDDGLISLEDPIRTFLPQFGSKRGPITIRQLMSQTHGIPANHPSIPQPGKDDTDSTMTLEKSVNEIAKDDRVQYPPGSKHHYQPAVAYHIAGRIAEVVTKEEWATLFKKRLGDPCEMAHFTYGKTRNPRIGGGAGCDLQDYTNLLQMHMGLGVFKGRRVLSEKMVNEMRADQLHGTPFTPPNGIHVASGYGLSWWFNMTEKDGTAVQTSVPGAYGPIPWINWKLGYGGFFNLQKSLAVSMQIYQDIYPPLNTLLGLPTEKIEVDMERVREQMSKAKKRKGGGGTRKKQQ
ncbi:MAG: beta-lactamase family protein [Nevskiales bacterium]|nr:beta-lactamase family protein [Nevskiales bacterium]